MNKNSVIAPSGNLEHLTTVYRTTQSKADGTLFFKETSEHGEFAAVMLIKKMTAVVEFNIQEAQQNPFVTVTYGELAKAAWACTSGNNTPQAFKNCNDWIGKAFGQSSSEASQETVLLSTRVTVTRNGPKMTITFTAVKK